MTELKTDETLIEALRQAAKRTLSPEQVRRQRISFIMSSVKDESGVTRAKVEDVLDRMEGRKVAK